MKTLTAMVLAAALAACGGTEEAAAVAPVESGAEKQVDVDAACTSACQHDGYQAGRWCACEMNSAFATCVCGGEPVVCAEAGCSELER